MIGEDETALRLVWHPKDFSADGKLKGAHFSQGDLLPLLDHNGTAKYVSMDRLQLVSKRSVDWKIERARDAKSKRTDVLFATFVCAELCILRGDAGDLLFEVREVPLAEHADGPGSPENLAHIGVASRTPCPESEDDRAVKVNELRTRLLESRRSTLTYAELFPVPSVA